MRARPLRLLAICALCGPVVAQDTRAEPQPFDACGVLIAGAGCTLIEAAGGRYVVPDAGDFAFGEAVRVVGTLDPECLTICEADGCIRGAVVYDPALLPCGTAIPDLPADLVSGLCTAASGAIAGLAAGGVWLGRRRGRALGG